MSQVYNNLEQRRKCPSGGWSPIHQSIQNLVSLPCLTKDTKSKTERRNRTQDPLQNGEV